MTIVDLTVSKQDIQRDGRSPVYQQLASALKRDIHSGLVGPGDFLPTEKGLQETLGLNHLTIRKAFDVLISEGIISRKRRVGTIVNPRDQWVKTPSSQSIGFLAWNHEAFVNDSREMHLFVSACQWAMKHDVLVASLPFNGDTSQLQKRINELNLDAIIVQGPTRNEHFDILQSISLPKIILEVNTTLPQTETIGINCFDGVYAGVTDLIEKGHRDIVYAAALIYSHKQDGKRIYQLAQDSGMRFDAYRRAMNDRGLGFAPQHYVELTYDQDTITTWVKERIDTQSIPEAIFCFDDTMAHHMYVALTQHGISVPDDISLLGVGCMPGIKLPFSLATVAINWQDMGEVAMTRISERLRFPDTSTHVRLEIGSHYQSGASIQSRNTPPPKKG